MSMRGKKILTVGLAASFIFGLAAAAWAGCTTVIVGKEASTDGSVMVSQSVDGAYDARIVVVPGGTHKKNETVPIYKNGCTDDVFGVKKSKVGEIPQVEKTYTYVHAGYPFMNEHKLIIGEDTWSGRAELENSEGIMMIEQLQILCLQRAKTARECVATMGALAEQYGYGDGGETLTVVDGNEGWVFDVVGPGPLWTKDSGTPGAIWAARRVPDDHIYVSSNRTRIGKIDLKNTADYMASSNVISAAQDLGFYDPKKDGEFIFSKVYNPKPYGSPYYQARREWRVFTLLIPSLAGKISPELADPDLDQYDFSYKVDKKITIREVMALYRDYYQDTPYDLSKGEAAGPFGNPFRATVPGEMKPAKVKNSDWERAIGIARCSYTLVGQSRSWMPDSVGAVAWIGEDVGYSTVFMPIYSGVSKTSPVFSEVNRSGFEQKSAWWAFNFVTNWVNLRFDAMMENEVRPLQKQLEDKLFADQPTVEKKALELDKQSPAKAKAYLTEYSAKTAEKITARWWQLAGDLIYNYQDGLVKTKDGGYPTKWLEEVDFGASQLPK